MKELRAVQSVSLKASTTWWKKITFGEWQRTTWYCDHTCSAIDGAKKSRKIQKPWKKLAILKRNRSWWTWWTNSRQNWRSIILTLILFILFTQLALMKLLGVLTITHLGVSFSTKRHWKFWNIYRIWNTFGWTAMVMKFPINWPAKQWKMSLNDSSKYFSFHYCCLVNFSII